MKTDGDFYQSANAPVRAMLVHPVLAGEDGGWRSDEAALEEGRGLARALDVELVAAQLVRLQTIRRGYFFTTGKLDEIAEQTDTHQAAMVIVNAPLAPVQQRNLETALNAKVLDRTGLILEIFARRAKTKEARLQVELAQLAWQKNRLVRFWTHLERQRGGKGFLAGPGERQIESDRRQIATRITALKKRLELVRKRRALHRTARRRSAWPSVALVGYSNAGKSTLFNRLTGAAVPARAALFSTLDPSMRACQLPGGGQCVLSDTVGFIANLPAELIASFRATLEEVEQADLILHVRDIAHPDTAAQKYDVDAVLQSMGIAAHDDRIIEVLNKTDLLSPPEQAGLQARGNMLPVSAQTGEGLPALLEAIRTRIMECNNMQAVHILLPPEQQGRALAFLKRRGRITDERIDDNGTASLDVLLSAGALGQFRKTFLESNGRGIIINTDSLL